MADTKPPEEKKDDNVEISKAALDELLSRLGTLEANQKLMLQVEDSNKLQKIEELRRSGKLVKEIKMRKLENKTIIGWKTLKDEVYFADGKLIENQTVEVWFDDGKKKELTMRQWASLPTYEAFEVVRESKDEHGEMYLKVRNKDGKELEVNVIYVN